MVLLGTAMRRCVSPTVSGEAPRRRRRLTHPSRTRSSRPAERSVPGRLAFFESPRSPSDHKDICYVGSMIDASEHHAVLVVGRAFYVDLTLSQLEELERVAEEHAAVTNLPLGVFVNGTVYDEETISGTL